MITYSTGNLFADFENGVTSAIAIPINCEGVMGKGVALEAKTRWPKLAAQWDKRCKEGVDGLSVKTLPGEVCFYGSIIFATTKDHYQNPSQIEWVESICKLLVKHCAPDEVVGLPAIGCGLGGLAWNDVKALYEKYLAESPIHFICYLPK